MATPQDRLTWSELVAGVTSLLGQHRNRRGVESDTAALIRQAVIDIQNAIPGYRVRHESIYLPTDFVDHSFASIGVLPPCAVVQDMWFLKKVADTYDEVNRWPMDVQLPWQDRYMLFAGDYNVDAGHAVVAIDNGAYQFVVYPLVEADCYVSVFWDGLKLSFKDDEETPFDEPVFMAVAEFVRAYLTRDIDHDLAGYNSMFQSYLRYRSNLYVNWTERKRIAS